MAMSQAHLSLQHAVQRAFARRAWDELAVWASRAERTEGLNVDVATRWALTCGLLHVDQKEAAARWYAPLHALLWSSNPKLARAMASVLGVEIDFRLGVEPQRQPREAPPKSVAEVEAKVLSLYGQEPWGKFASSMRAWCEQLPDGAVRRTLWLLLAQLSAREMSRRIASGHGTSLAAPAQLFRLSVEALGTSPELVDELSTMLKLLKAAKASSVLGANGLKEIAPILVAASAPSTPRAQSSVPLRAARSTVLRKAPPPRNGKPRKVSAKSKRKAARAEGGSPP